MKIIVITQDAPIYIPQFLDDFFDLIKEEHKVDSIIIFSAYQKKFLGELVYRLSFYGIVDFFKMSFLVLNLKLKSFIFFPFSIKCFSVSNVIKKYNLNQKKISHPNDPKFIDYVKKRKIDLIISIASPKIFKSEILKTPKKGCINYHTGLLPKYRGVVPLFWALLNNEKRVGITVHLMDEKLDNGPIVIQKRVTVGDDSLHSLFEKTINVGPAILIEAMSKIAAGQKKFIYNNPQKATYFGFPSPADANLFKKRGGRFF